MTLRSDHLRRRNRKIFLWSFGGAAVLHLVVLGFTPPFSPKGIGEGATPSSRPGGELVDPLVVDAFFGPPTLVRDDGTLVVEPPSRTLAARNLEVGGEVRGRRCLPSFEGRSTPVYAMLRLEVGESGRVAESEIHRATGDPCTDALMVAIGRSLRYHWLPSEAFPAPVHLLQPVMVGWGGGGEGEGESDLRFREDGIASSSATPATPEVGSEPILPSPFDPYAARPPPAPLR